MRKRTWLDASWKSSIGCKLPRGHFPLVPSRQPRRHMGRAAGMSRTLLGRKRSAVLGHRRRTRPHAPRRIRSRRIAGLYAGLRRSGRAVGLLPGRIPPSARGASRAAQRTVLAVTAARGLPMGEHLRLGPCDEALQSELAHVPLLFRFPDRLGQSRGARHWSSRLIFGPRCSIGGRLPARRPRRRACLSCRWCTRRRSTTRERLVFAGPGQQRTIRTPAWYLRKAESPELYVKPNEISIGSQRRGQPLPGCRRLFARCGGPV